MRQKDERKRPLLSRASCPLGDKMNTCETGGTVTGSVTHAWCHAQVKRGWDTEELPGPCSRDRASTGRV